MLDEVKSPYSIAGNEIQVAFWAGRTAIVHFQYPYCTILPKFHF
jgi:hypothetical protein